MGRRGNSGRGWGTSGHWRRRQGSDPFMARAAREGWRSRAVYKLQQIQSRERILTRGMTCVDLGASPGGWSQYAARVVGPGGRIWALDREPMAPLDGVSFIRGDFTDAQAVGMLREALGESRVDLVMSDMAPNISGNRAVDQPRAMHLAEEALAFSCAVLDEGGHFLVKLFQGEGFEDFVGAAGDRFRRVRVIKPRASRPESREMYLLARSYGM